MSDELVDGIHAEANGIAIEPKAADDEDLRIPVGTTYQTGAGVVETYRTVSQMQANILSWASTLSPAYQNYAQKMIDAGFMPESYRAQPTNAASAVLYPAKVFAAYKANGGELAFNEWFDWYSQTAKAYRDANDPNRGRGRKPSYMNKEDVQTMADTAARAGIGRGLTDKESKEALQAVVRVRSRTSLTTRTSQLRSAGRFCNRSFPITLSSFRISSIQLFLTQWHP